MFDPWLRNLASVMRSGIQSGLSAGASASHAHPCLLDVNLRRALLPEGDPLVISLLFGDRWLKSPRRLQRCLTGVYPKKMLVPVRSRSAKLRVSYVSRAIIVSLLYHIRMSYYITVSPKSGD
jgi:hypothetical protein